MMMGCISEPKNHCITMNALGKSNSVALTQVLIKNVRIAIMTIELNSRFCRMCGKFPII